MTSSLIAPVHQSARCTGFISDLILRCAQGEEAALGTLFDLFLPAVLAVVGNGTPPRETDELVVEAFHRVWAQAATYDPAARNAVGWVLEQAREARGGCLSQL